VQGGGYPISEALLKIGGIMLSDRARVGRWWAAPLNDIETTHGSEDRSFAIIYSPEPDAKDVTGAARDLPHLRYMIERRIRQHPAMMTQLTRASRPE
jgi:hypothetical protein